MLQRWMRYIRNVFGFSRGEAVGFSMMLGILLLVYAALFVYRQMPAAPYQPWADQQELDSLISLLEKADTLQKKSTGEQLKRAEVPLNLFLFDPNTVSYDSLLQLGFPPYLAQRLIKYRSKGGQFRKKEDLQKLYGLPQELYAALLPWMRLQPVAKPKRKWERDSAKRTYIAYEKPAPKVPVKFDLNLVDSAQLVAVRGIGPVLSARILKFRSSLGGFVHKEQVREVWGLAPETADVLLEQAYLEQPPETLLAINTADVSQLDKHPYISRKQAEQIVAYRSQHGNFQKPEDLLQLHTLDQSFIDKIAPYLQF